MRIVFGWGYDGARWSPTDSLGEYITGPMGLTELFVGRLGLQAPSAVGVQRIAAYRNALAVVLQNTNQEPVSLWFATSFSVDPWATARELLAWRDELVAAGWTGQHAADAQQLHRINALAQVETVFTASPGWLPGFADILRDISTELEWLVSQGISWDVGISSIALEHARADLPALWQRILDHVEQLGVDVAEMPEPPPLGELRLIEADSVWEAATVGAQVHAAQGDSPCTVIAGSSTHLLDAERARHNVPTIGVREQSNLRPGAQLLSAFTAAVTAPHDVHAIASLLELPLAGIETASGTAEVRLWPSVVRRGFLAALRSQPGVAGSAWQHALQRIREHGEEALYELAETFDQLVAREPLVVTDAHYSTEALLERLRWLTKRLQALRHNLDGEVAALETAATHVSTVVEVVATYGEAIAQHEFKAIVQDTCGTGGAVVDGQQQGASATTDVVLTPGQLGRGTAPVIWWLPFDGTTGLARDTARAPELAYLRSQGIEPAGAEQLAKLQLESQLRAVRHRGKLTAIISKATVTGESSAPHPLLTFLLDDIRVQHPGKTLEQVTEDVTNDVHTESPAATVRPELVTLRRQNSARFSVTPGEQLIPERMSYSQWTNLLIHPIEWLFDKQLRIKPADRSQIPTGNQMIGSWLHAAVEQLVEDHLAETTSALMQPSPEDIRATLEQLLPVYAAELLMAGRRRQRLALLADGTRTIGTLFNTLAEAGARITGVEQPFETTIPGSRGKNGQPLVLNGLRDLDVELADGRRAIIDLKYSGAKNLHARWIQQGIALQLAVYAHSINSQGGAGQLRRIPTAYFQLKYGAMLTEFNGLGAAQTLVAQPVEDQPDHTDDLWSRAVAGLNLVLDRLREGAVYDFGNLIMRAQWQDYEKALKQNDGTDAVATPADAELLTDLQHARKRGFLPEDAAKFVDYPLLSGVEEL